MKNKIVLLQILILSLPNLNFGSSKQFLCRNTPHRFQEKKDIDPQQLTVQHVAKVFDEETVSDLSNEVSCSNPKIALRPQKAPSQLPSNLSLPSAENENLETVDWVSLNDDKELTTESPASPARKSPDIIEGSSLFHSIQNSKAIKILEQNRPTASTLKRAFQAITSVNLRLYSDPVWTRPMTAKENLVIDMATTRLLKRCNQIFESGEHPITTYVPDEETLRIQNLNSLIQTKILWLHQKKAETLKNEANRTIQYLTARDGFITKQEKEKIYKDYEKQGETKLTSQVNEYIWKINRAIEAEKLKLHKPKRSILLPKMKLSVKEAETTEVRPFQELTQYPKLQEFAKVYQYVTQVIDDDFEHPLQPKDFDWRDYLDTTKHDDFFNPSYQKYDSQHQEQVEDVKKCLGFIRILLKLAYTADRIAPPPTPPTPIGEDSKS